MSGEHDQIGNPKKWRLRAEQTRVAAEDMQDPVNKAAALRLADDYERIARKAEEEERLSNSDKVAEVTSESLRSESSSRAPEHGQHGSHQSSEDHSRIDP
jgi:hypothetical protein